jgi:hypothetical protein
MARTCTICEDPRRDEFDRHAILGDPIAKIAQEFALSYDALYRHVKADHHIRDVTTIPTTSELATSGDILREITEHHKEAVRLKDLAEDNGDLKTAMLGLDKALKCLELVAKIQGQIQEQSISIYQQNVLINNPEWIELRTMIISALEPYPEAKEAVIHAVHA